ncbi:hypothetical protein NPIL_323011 [Nephila pilipes]|uniref:Uncharacterized protein n=1 Tax=Nephila pilipes TaxID=299642 RepID=A0A8X6Q1V4_NEPPI|nr:hypothetical protein NPIL_323011 [Nephila pilipes]
MGVPRLGTPCASTPKFLSQHLPNQELTFFRTLAALRTGTHTYTLCYCHQSAHYNTGLQKKPLKEIVEKQQKRLEVLVSVWEQLDVVLRAPELRQRSSSSYQSLTAWYLSKEGNLNALWLEDEMVIFHWMMKAGVDSP